MQKRGVRYPNTLLRSDDTALVQVRAVLRPGIRKGDHFDVEVKSPDDADVTSLRGGWLLDSRLTEVAVLEGRWTEGHVFAAAKGPILVDPNIDAETDPQSLLRGRILGGGVAAKDRKLGLAIITRPDFVLSKSLGDAINRRFYAYDRAGMKAGVATPKTDDYIELTVHPRYQDNVSRFMRVVRSVAVSERPEETIARLESLQRHC